MEPIPFGNPLNSVPFDINDLRAYPEFNWDTVEAIDAIHNNIAKTYGNVGKATLKNLSPIEGRINNVGEKIINNAIPAIDQIGGNIQRTDDAIIQSMQDNFTPINSAWGDSGTNAQWYFVGVNCGGFLRWRIQQSPFGVDGIAFGGYSNPIALAIVVVDILHQYWHNDMLLSEQPGQETFGVFIRQAYIGVSNQLDTYFGPDGPRKELTDLIYRGEPNEVENWCQGIGDKRTYPTPSPDVTGQDQTGVLAPNQQPGTSITGTTSPMQMFSGSLHICYDPMALGVPDIDDGKTSYWTYTNENGTAFEYSVIPYPRGQTPDLHILYGTPAGTPFLRQGGPFDTEKQAYDFGGILVNSACVQPPPPTPAPGPYPPPPPPGPYPPPPPPGPYPPPHEPYPPPTSCPPCPTLPPDCCKDYEPVMKWAIEQICSCLVNPPPPPPPPPLGGGDSCEDWNKDAYAIAKCSQQDYQWLMDDENVVENSIQGLETIGDAQRKYQEVFLLPAK